MRRHTHCIVWAATLLLLGSCQQSDRDLRQAAQHYLDATADYNVELACQYCTPQTADGLRLIDTTLLRMAGPAVIEANTPATVRIKSVEHTSDTTALVVYHKHTPADDYSDTLRMVRRDERWMAHMPIAIPPMIPLQSEMTFNYDSIGPLSIRKGE